VKSFRMFTSQLYLDGKVKQSTLVKVFGVERGHDKPGAGFRGNPGGLEM